MANPRAELYKAVKNLVEHVRTTTTREIISNHNDGNLNGEKATLNVAVSSVKQASQKAENDGFHEIEAWVKKYLT